MSGPSSHVGRCAVALFIGTLEGLKLTRFMIWERRAGGRTVTFPARQDWVNGERLSFALLRPAASRAKRL